MALVGSVPVAQAALTPDQVAQLPPAAQVPVDFARQLYGTLKPGSSLLLTDEPIALDGVQNMTVLTDEPDTEHNAERP